MTQFQSFCLYVDTALIIIFTLVYIFRGNKKDSGQEQPAAQEAPAVPQQTYNNESAVSQLTPTGISEGDIRLVGVDDEDLPVILAGISAAANIPMSALKIKSISRI